MSEKKAPPNKNLSLFIAAYLDKTALAKLEHATAACRQQHPDLRWLAPESWHITLVYLGRFSQEEALALKHACQKHASALILPQHPLQTQSGVLLPTHKPRVLAWRITPDHVCITLQQACLSLLEKLNGSYDATSLIPHLSVARYAARQQPEASACLDAMNGPEAPWVLGTIKHIHLMQTHPERAQHAGTQTAPPATLARYQSLHHFKTREA